jgi:hypothetical protein
MTDDTLVRLSRIHRAWTPLLTLLACALVVAAGLSGHPVLLTLTCIAVALAVASAIQACAVAPLAAELLRMREQLARLRS